MVHPLAKQKEVSNKFLAGNASEFDDITGKINSNKFINQFRTEKKIPKAFSDYRMPIELFEDLRDGNVDPKEVLKNQVKFKSDISEIKAGSNNSEDKKTYNKKCYFLNL